MQPVICVVLCVLQADILDVNQIFRDLGMMVHEQGEIVGNFCFFSSLFHGHCDDDGSLTLAVTCWSSVIFVNENETGEKRENNEFVNEN